MKTHAFAVTGLLALFLWDGDLPPNGENGRSLPAYEEIEVSNGGTILGRVTFHGPPPEAETLHVSKDQEFCGETIPSPVYRVSTDGAIQDVVVSIVEISRGKAGPRGSIRVHNSHCMFEPHVQAATTTQKTLELLNDDPVIHNTHPYLRRRTLFNLALPIQGMAIKKSLRGRPGIIHVKCDAHEWMEGWVVVLGHPYYDVTDEGGTFRIEAVPPGTYRLQAWHERLGTIEQEVVVETGKEVRLSFQFPAEG